MSVKEARKLLGKDAEHMSDEDVEKIIEDTDKLARLALEVAKEKVLKDKQKIPSFSLTQIPADTYVSPAYLFAWWDGAIKQHGQEAALDEKTPDFKLARELWVAAVFAVGMRKQSGEEHWVKAVKDNAPDAIVAYFPKDERGYGELKYNIEVTTYGKHSDTLEAVLKAKLDKKYPDYTRIICYITDRERPEDIDVAALRKFVEQNNPTGFEVWLLGLAESPKDADGENPLRLDCLTMVERIDIYYNKEKLVQNVGDAFKVGKGFNTGGLVEKVGRMHLQFPAKKAVKDKPSGKKHT